MSPKKPKKSQKLFKLLNLVTLVWSVVHLVLALKVPLKYSNLIAFHGYFSRYYSLLLKAGGEANQDYEV